MPNLEIRSTIHTITNTSVKLQGRDTYTACIYMMMLTRFQLLQHELSVTTHTHESAIPCMSTLYTQFNITQHICTNVMISRINISTQCHSNTTKKDNTTEVSVTFSTKN